MKKILSLLLIIIISTTTGCSKYIKGRTEINKVIFVRVFAIDKGENGKVRVTVSSKNVALNGGSATSESKSASNIIAEGDTVFDAVRNLLSYADKRPYYGHVEYILFSEDISKDGLLPYMDFISRDHEFRFNAKLYIVKGCSAQEVLEKASTSQYFVAERLRNLEDASDGLSITSKVTLSEAMFIFDNDKLSTFIPYIELKKVIKKEAADVHKSDIIMGGYAVFKGDKLHTFLDEQQSRGINWVKNRIRSGVLIVKDKNDKNISMEIINNNSKIVPEINDKKIKCTINTNLTTNIGEITSRVNVFTVEYIDHLEEEQEKVTESEIRSALEFAQKNNMDIFGILSSLILKYPMKKRELSQQWHELFPKIDFTIEINSAINRTYMLNEPTGMGDESTGED